LLLLLLLLLLLPTSKNPRASDNEDKEMYTAATACYSLSKVFR